MVKVLRLLLSSYTYVRILTFNLHVGSTSFICRAITFSNVFWCFKQANHYMIKLPICGSKNEQSKQKCLPPLDIHKSKLIGKVSQDSRTSWMNFSLVVLASIDKMLFINWCIDGKSIEGFCLKTNLWRNGDSTKKKGTNPLAINRTKSISN